MNEFKYLEISVVTNELSNDLELWEYLLSIKESTNLEKRIKTCSNFFLLNQFLLVFHEEVTKKFKELEFSITDKERYDNYIRMPKKYTKLRRMIRMMNDKELEYPKEFALDEKPKFQQFKKEILENIDKVEGLKRKDYFCFAKVAYYERLKGVNKENPINIEEPLEGIFKVFFWNRDIYVGGLSNSMFNGFGVLIKYNYDKNKPICIVSNWKDGKIDYSSRIKQYSYLKNIVEIHHRETTRDYTGISFIGIRYFPHDGKLLNECIKQNLPKEVEYILNESTKFNSQLHEEVNQTRKESIAVSAFKNPKTSTLIIQSILGYGKRKPYKFKNWYNSFSHTSFDGSFSFLMNPTYISHTVLYTCIDQSSQKINLTHLKLLLSETYPNLNINKGRTKYKSKPISDMQAGQRSTIEKRFLSKGCNTRITMNRNLTPMQRVFIDGNEVEAFMLLYDYGATPEQVIFQFTGRPKNGKAIGEKLILIKSALSKGWSLETHKYFPRFYKRNYLWPLILYSEKKRHLPVEIIMEILSYVPVEFKCELKSGKKTVKWNEIKELKDEMRKPRRILGDGKELLKDYKEGERNKKSKWSEKKKKLYRLISILHHFNLTFTREQKLYEYMEKDEKNLRELEYIREGKTRVWRNSFKCYVWE